MQKIRFIFLFLLLALSPSILNAQEDELIVGLRVGHNESFGGFAAISLEADQKFNGNFAVNGGIQYNTIGKSSIVACPAYSIYSMTIINHI